MANIKFNVIVLPDGTAEIRLPEGASQQRDANKIAKFTDKLSKLLGRVKERHIGDHEHHVKEDTGTHVHTDGSVHHDHK